MSFPADHVNARAFGGSNLSAKLLFPLLIKYLSSMIFRDGAHKEVGIYTTTMLAIILVLVHAFLGLADTGTAILIMLQLFFSGVVVIYLDDVLKKGYGLLPSIPLFTAGNIW